MKKLLCLAFLAWGIPCAWAVPPGLGNSIGTPAQATSDTDEFNASQQINGAWASRSMTGLQLKTYVDASLAPVAFSGSYADLGNKPAIPAAQVNSDWNASSGVAAILNKPTIPAAQVNSDWNAGSGVAQIFNKPTIPTNNNQLSNGAGYITSSGTATSITGTITTAHVSGLSSTATTGTATSVPVSGITGAGAGVTAAMGNAVNAPGAIVISTSDNSIAHLGVLNVGPSAATVFCVGDSTTWGSGVTDMRQSYPCVLSTLGFPLNGCTVLKWGFIAWTTFSVNNIYATGESVTAYTGGVLASTSTTTAPGSVTGTGNYAVVYLGTNDYYGHYLTATLSTSSGTITGMTTQTYLVDGAGHARIIAVGDQVTGTGIPANTTVASVVSGSSLVLSNTPTVAGSQLLTFTPTPTSSTFHADIRSLVGKLKASGYKVVVCTLPPANNTTATPSNNTGAQGDFQASRLVYNTDIRSMTYDGAGSDPDALCDLANLTDFSSFNAALFYTDFLHPNLYGNQRIAAAVNDTLLKAFGTSYSVSLAGSESVPDTSLSNNVALLNAANAFGPNQSFGSAAPGNTGTVTLWDKILLEGSGVGDTTPDITLIPASAQGSTIHVRGGSSGTMTLAVNAGSLTIFGAGTLNGQQLGFTETPTGAITLGGYGSYTFLDNAGNGANANTWQYWAATSGGNAITFFMQDVSGNGFSWLWTYGTNTGGGGVNGTITLGDSKSGTTELAIYPGASGGVGAPVLRSSSGTIIFGTQHTPADNAAGVVGQEEVDGGFIYVWTGTATVMRAALSNY
jgi:lysophospholipase L1-like esterase